MELLLTVNGFDLVARYPEETVRCVLLPLLQELSRRQREAGGRLILLLAAPPGAGKSTLAAALAHLSRQESDLAPVQALGMDGFHYRQSYLQTHTALRGGREISLAQIKGAPESFNAAGLLQALTEARQHDVRWPVYDRRIHDVSDETIVVRAPVLIVEGNWLLLNRPVWRGLPRDASLFLRADEALLHERLVARKVRGGLARAEAEAFYRRSDGPNVRLCLTESLPADRTLLLTDGGALLPG